MDAMEAVTLCRMAKAACPQQHFDEMTPDAWFALLSDLTFEDCRLAMIEAVREKPFVAPAEIRTKVKRIRAKRLAETPMPEPPPDLTPLQTIAWLKDARRRIADGEPATGDQRELKPHPLPELRQLIQRPDQTEETSHE